MQIDEPASSKEGPTTSTEAPKAAAEEDESPVEVPSSPEGIIDLDTFQQIRDMDEDDDEEQDEDSDPREFSRGIVYGFFDQAEKTFAEMAEALLVEFPCDHHAMRLTQSAQSDLEKLSSLGHFLKGSSAALGIVRVQANCEKIQHYGHCQDDDGRRVEDNAALEKIKGLLVDCKKDYAVAKAWLVNLYENE